MNDRELDALLLQLQEFENHQRLEDDKLGSEVLFRAAASIRALRQERDDAVTAAQVVYRILNELKGAARLVLVQISDAYAPGGHRLEMSRMVPTAALEALRVLAATAPAEDPTT